MTGAAGAVRWRGAYVSCVAGPCVWQMLLHPCLHCAAPAALPTMACGADALFDSEHRARRVRCRPCLLPRTLAEHHRRVERVSSRENLCMCSEHEMAEATRTASAQIWRAHLTHHALLRRCQGGSHRPPFLVPKPSAAPAVDRGCCRQRRTRLGMARLSNRDRNTGWSAVSAPRGVRRRDAVTLRPVPRRNAVASCSISRARYTRFCSRLRPTPETSLTSHLHRRRDLIAISQTSSI